jgi:FKBP-type peptidyl-prolyl cis-trans isomerase
MAASRLQASAVLRAGVVLSTLSLTALGIGVAAGTAGASVHAAGSAAKRGHAKVWPVISNAKNLAKEPVVHAVKGKPPKKLLVKNLVVGTGPAATATSVVSVKYVGANYATGRDFTRATWEAGKPTTFQLDGGVIRGFAEGIFGMKVGGRREIVIPPSLGYGSEGGGPIKPNETLVFVVDLVSVSS